ncbi:hypothetical protein RND81_12G214000 [Saponaria officinalis]|uniref:DC1 domain-containing protein n=1 Tax=Saponaria officinalis TaxID=3572 RepID=A0AAW1HDR3_SAPOF
MMDHQETNLIQHKIHPKHPLKQVYKNSKFDCKACKCKGRGFRYRCEKCDFNIHPICGTGHESISTFTHPQHTVQLVQQSIFSDHKCDLCCKTVRGTVYRCKGCHFYLHPICSQVPEFLYGHVMHPPHPIRLRLMESKKCDVCNKSCKNWRYNCEICDVHIHVGCLTVKQKTGGDDDDGGFGDFFDELMVDFAVGALTGGISV